MVLDKWLNKTKTFYYLATLHHYQVKLNKLLRLYYKTERNNELKEINFKNWTWYYSDGIIKFEYLDLDNFLIDEKSYEKILVYKISCKTLIGDKPLQISFDKIDRLINSMMEIDI